MQWHCIVGYTLSVSLESNQCRTGAEWIETARVRVTLSLSQLSSRLGEAETDPEQEYSDRAEDGGYVEHSWPLIGSNYQLWLSSPIVHMTSPAPVPGHHPPHSQCILQVKMGLSWLYLSLMTGPPRVAAPARWQRLDEAEWPRLGHLQ